MNEVRKVFLCMLLGGWGTAVVSAVAPIPFAFCDEENDGLALSRVIETLEGEVPFPQPMEDKPITRIGERAFAFQIRMTSLNLPPTLKTIDAYAFMGCVSLTELTLPDGLQELGHGVFMGCTGLTSVFIPASVTRIHSNPFVDCYQVKISLDPKNKSYCLEEEGLFDAAKTTLVSAPPEVDYYTLSTTVTAIGPFAVAGYPRLISVVLPESLKTIDAFAFKGCLNLSMVALPKGLVTLNEGAFLDCVNLTSMTLPEGLSEIAEKTFYGCTSLTTVIVSKGPTRIGKEAFRDCTSLTHLALPEGLTTIEASAFRACTSLSSVTFPSTLQSIHAGAFDDCKGIQKIVFKGPPPIVEDCSNKVDPWLSELDLPSMETFPPTIGYYYPTVADAWETALGGPVGQWKNLQMQPLPAHLRPQPVETPSSQRPETPSPSTTPRASTATPPTTTAFTWLWVSLLIGGSSLLTLLGIGFVRHYRCLKKRLHAYEAEDDDLSP